MLTHSEINERFLALDHHPVLLRATLDGWLAWPIIKERLWLLCLQQADKRARVSSDISEGLTRLASGTFQAIANLVFAGSCNGALLHEAREVRLPDGRHVHPHLGDLSRIEVGGSWLRYYYEWGEHRSLFPRRGTLNDRGIAAVCAAAAGAISRTSVVRNLAVALTAAISPALPEVDSRRLLATTADQLGRFRVRFALMRRLLQRWRAPRVVVLDPDGKVPEVAAAKSLGLLVTEVQHGMFSCREPDYSWGPEHRALPCRMPLPDRVVVFGPFWRRQLHRAGYWRGDEIVEICNPVLREFRQLRTSRVRRTQGAPLRILFPTQGYVRTAAIPFWHDVLRLQESHSVDAFRLRIKIHPLEQDAYSEYEALVRTFPCKVSLAPSDSDAFEEMLEADLVAGYTSLMLMEAVGLGIPALGLRGGSAREGFSETFAAPELKSVIPSFERPLDVWARISDLCNGHRLDALAKETLDAGAQLYTLDGPGVESAILS